MQIARQPAQPARYNALPLLDDARTRLRRQMPEFQEFLEDAQRVLGKLGVVDGAGLGAFLLHRHWPLRDNQVMLEEERTLGDGSPIWVTSAAQRRRARIAQAAPSRWVIDSGSNKLVALELSTDPIVIKANTVFQQNPQVLDALARLIIEHGLDETIGLQFIPRRSLAGRKYSDFVETNEGGLSVVKGENLTPRARALCIKVCWPLSIRRAANMVCCYCMHHPGGSCRHPKPDPPPICSPHGCVKPNPDGGPTVPTRKRRKKRKPVVDPRARRIR